MSSLNGSSMTALMRHPNDAGYAKMAAVWFAGILQALATGFVTPARDNGIAADEPPSLVLDVIHSNNHHVLLYHILIPRDLIQAPSKSYVAHADPSECTQRPQ
jgi:hypothetical protein